MISRVCATIDNSYIYLRNEIGNFEIVTHLRVSREMYSGNTVTIYTSYYFKFV